MQRTQLSNVWPLNRVDRRFAEDLHRLFPDVLVIWHPVLDRWQVYETTRRANWSAERLVNAIVGERELRQHVKENTDAAIEWMKGKWWNWPGHPLCLEDHLPRWPGTWLLQYLKESDVPTVEYLRRIEESRVADELKRRRDRHDVHAWIASETYRHARDFYHGDPMAGKRKWVAPVGIDLKGGSH